MSDSTTKTVLIIEVEAINDPEDCTVTITTSCWRCPVGDVP